MHTTDKQFILRHRTSDKHDLNFKSVFFHFYGLFFIFIIFFYLRNFFSNFLVLQCRLYFSFKCIAQISRVFGLRMRDRKVLVRNSWGKFEGKKCGHNSWRCCAQSEREHANFSILSIRMENLKNAIIMS